MKMIVAIMPEGLSDEISKVLIGNDYRVTKFASTAGFLQVGTTTLMIGVESSRVEKALALIREYIPVKDHTQATIYVIDIKMFEKI